MSIDLDVIQRMWEQDSKIDTDNLHTESLNIPVLHSKYFEMYNTILLLKKRAEQQKKALGTNDMNTSLAKQTLMFMWKTHFLKK
jgi:hypothetical protein